MTTNKSGRGGKRENSGRPAQWQSGNTTAIRIPAKFKKDLLTIAKKWDNPENLVKPETDLLLLVEQLQKENQQLKEKLANSSLNNTDNIEIKELKKENNNYSFLEIIDSNSTQSTVHCVMVNDCLETLKKIPDESIQLIICDPPYNINISEWDNFNNYIYWASQWLKEAERVLSKTGNLVIFGGLQYQDQAGTGDLLEIISYLRKNSNLLLINLIIWHYRNGKSAKRFFANRHEEIAWFSKTKQYYFDLDSVREEYEDKKKQVYFKDTRLKHETIEKGRNPTNVWPINRLNRNSKERVGHLTQKPYQIIERLVKSLSYEGSTILDFFAGSCITSRVAIQEKRHSIISDYDPIIYQYLEEQLKKISNDLFLEKDNYKIIHEINFKQHPIFKKI